MEFIVNDLSFHGQFQDLTTFRAAINQVMEIRQISRRFGRSLHCHRDIAQAQVTPSMTMPQAVQALTQNEQRALMQWLTQQGPFWDDARKHEQDDWLECNGQIVTDTAVGEAGWCCMNGIERGLVSLTPSSWLFSPATVNLVSDIGSIKSVDVLNFWTPDSFESFLKTAPVPLLAWDQLEDQARAQCTELVFALNAFTPMIGHPFVSSAAQRLLFILITLNRFKSCFEDNGQRSQEGHDIYRDFFTGKKGGGGRGALFTDSSEDEKNTYEAELTFTHPADASKSLFCPWHGKVQTPQLRVHFSYPVRADEPLYVVYVGPKLTKR